MFKSDPLRQDWTRELPQHWLDSSAFKSHFLDALSITLPGCERFFIQSVREYITDTEVQEFVRQEAAHRAAHADYNRWLTSHGYPVAQLEAVQNARWDLLQRFSPVWQLAVVTAVEHVTVCYAQVFLESPELLASMHPHFREIWQWHSVEETEHAHVTMDLWNRLGYSDWYRRAAMTLVLPAYFWYVGKNCLVLLHQDGLLFRSETWLDFFDLLFSHRHGIIRRSWSRWMSFYQSKFSPGRDQGSNHMPKFV